MLAPSTFFTAALATLPFLSQLTAAAPAPTEAQELAKKDGYRTTWYNTDVGLGACGKWHSNSEYTVALNQAQFGTSYPSPECGKSIWISYGGKTVEATIQDSCPGCPWGGLDLSPGLFEALAPLGTGVISTTWGYSGDSQPQSNDNGNDDNNGNNNDNGNDSGDNNSQSDKSCASSTFTIFNGDETLYSEPYFTTKLGKVYLWNWAVRSNLVNLLNQADSYCRDGVYHSFDGNYDGVLSHFDF